MKNLIKGICLLLTFSFTIMEGKAQDYFQEEYPKVWERTTAYSRTIAESMPEQLYNFKVYQDGMSFKEQQLHIVGNISFLCRHITGEYKNFYSRDEIKGLSKKQVLQISDVAFSYVADLIESTKPSVLSQKVMFKGTEMTKMNIFYLIRSHAIHHLGQSIIYLRMNDIEAPEYVGW
ncbi:DinB family protein [Marivirga salinae]|uniref:DinB family protein n=1 Tax=Marivirga salinarum TaxID=3059078 RepID=A0AA49GC92_9BACT|nr:DinB family protein [Marivirga sp. BDSF4-3]WKK75371.1 DinB family protein [Marivirga sp. BDSF4-3]